MNGNLALVFSSLVGIALVGCARRDCRDLGEHEQLLAGNGTQALQVSIETRFVTVADDFYDQLGIDFDLDVDMELTHQPHSFVGGGVSNGPRAVNSAIFGGAEGRDNITANFFSPRAFAPIAGTVFDTAAFVGTPFEHCVLVPDFLSQQVDDVRRPLVAPVQSHFSG
jgi:hypothetical protein